MPLAMTGSRARLPSADSTRREPATEPAHNVTLSRPTSVSARTCRGCDGSRATRVGHTLGMGDTSGHHRSRWRLTPWGWILTVAVPVLVVLAIVDPSPGVIMGLIVAIFVWAGLLASSFPSSRANWTYRGNPRSTDFGRETAERYERERGYGD